VGVGIKTLAKGCLAHVREDAASFFRGNALTLQGLHKVHGADVTAMVLSAKEGLGHSTAQERLRGLFADKGYSQGRCLSLTEPGTTGCRAAAPYSPCPVPQRLREQPPPERSQGARPSSPRQLAGHAGMASNTAQENGKVVRSTRNSLNPGLRDFFRTMITHVGRAHPKEKLISKTNPRPHSLTFRTPKPAKRRREASTEVGRADGLPAPASFPATHGCTSAWAAVKRLLGARTRVCCRKCSAWGDTCSAERSTFALRTLARMASSLGPSNGGVPACTPE
jgi:hypothetical protein